MATSIKKSGKTQNQWVVSFIGCPKDLRGGPSAAWDFARMQQVVVSTTIRRPSGG